MAASADGDGFAGRGGGAFRPSAVAAVAAFAAAARAAGDGPGNGGGIAALRRHWLTVRGTVTVHQSGHFAIWRVRGPDLAWFARSNGAGDDPTPPRHLPALPASGAAC